MSDVHPGINAYLSEAGVLQDGQLDRSWFEDSCERSRRAIEEGRIESDRELQRALDGEL